MGFTNIMSAEGQLGLYRNYGIKLGEFLFDAYRTDLEDVLPDFESIKNYCNDRKTGFLQSFLGFCLKQHSNKLGEILEILLSQCDEKERNKIYIVLSNVRQKYKKQDNMGHYPLGGDNDVSPHAFSGETINKKDIIFIIISSNDGLQNINSDAEKKIVKIDYKKISRANRNFYLGCKEDEETLRKHITDMLPGDTHHYYAVYCIEGVQDISGFKEGATSDCHAASLKKLDGQDMRCLGYVSDEAYLNLSRDIQFYNLGD